MSQSKHNDYSNLDQNEKDRRLYEACANGEHHEMSKLIAAGADVSTTQGKRLSLLDIAAIADDVGAIDMLVEAGASLAGNPNHNNTPLHYAAKESSINAVITLLNIGANVYARDDNDHTPLEIAPAPVATIMQKHLRGITTFDSDGYATAVSIDDELSSDDASISFQDIVVGSGAAAAASVLPDASSKGVVRKR